MKQKIAIIVSLVLIVGLMWTSSVFAQEVDEDGFPVALVVTEEPMEDPTEEPMEEPNEELEEINPVCEGLFEHPVLIRIANQYDVSPDDLQMYFCEYDFGVGEIIHLFETIARTEEEISLEDILAMRTDEELGWGEIWQSLGLIGRGKNGDDSEDTAETESLARNENREKFKHQTANSGEDDELKNENKPETPPGQSDEKNPNKPVTPPGQDKEKNPDNLGHPSGKDKDKSHPGNGKKP